MTAPVPCYRHSLAKNVEVGVAGGEILRLRQGNFTPALDRGILWMALRRYRKEDEGMQAYRARYERGRIVPLGNHAIPEGSDLILTVLDTPAQDNALRRQQRAVDEFLENIRNCNEPLGPAFDEALNQRFNIARELEL